MGIGNFSNLEKGLANKVKPEDKAGEAVSDVKITWGNQGDKQRYKERIEYFSTVTPLNINSLESVLGDKEAQVEIANQIEQFRIKNIQLRASNSEVDEQIKKKFKFANGDEVLVGDLILINLFASSHVSRDVNGKLQILDSETKTQRPFTISEITRKTGRTFHFNYLRKDMNSGIKNKKEEENKIYPTSFRYWQIVSPNIIKQGILRSEDFPIKRENEFGRHERKISRTKPTVYFSGDGIYAKYFMGRGKFFGTEKKINHENTYVLLLDKNTAGVVEEIHGKKEILYTFPLLSKDEFEKKKEQFVEKNNAKGKEVTKKILNTSISVGEEEMKGRVKEYAITDHIKQKNGESVTAYAERISKLSDLNYTLGVFREFMGGLGIGAHNFKWDEQLVLANALTSVDSKEKITKFAKEYGEAGLRTFLSVEQGGKPMGSKIITIGEKLPEVSADLLFKKYGEIINEVETAVEYLSANLGEKTTPELVEQTREHLLISGKQLLERYAKDADICKGMECEVLGREIEQKMNDINTSVIIFASTCKALVKNGQFNFEDFKDVELSFERGGISDQNKLEIKKMAVENTKQYPEKLKQYWLGTAEDALENPKQNEIIINVKLKGEAIASMRVSENPDGSFYGASFNVNPAIKGSRVGTELLERVIEDYTKNGDFKADVYEGNPMRETYKEQFGFEEVGATENYHDTGATVIQILKRKQV